MTTTAYIGLGTNLGDREGNIRRASILLAERAGEVVALSSLYETEPWGFESEHPFLNAVIVVRTDLDPMTLLDVTRQIELEMGRVTKSDGRYHDRPIDIDLLLMDDLVMRNERLTLPHPLMQQRRFVLEPLAEVAPNLTHPLLGKTIHELLDAIH